MSTEFPAFDHLSVTGQGQVEAVPDRAVLAFTVEATDRTLSLAHSEASRRMAQVLAKLREHGVADERIRTAWYDATPLRDYNRPRRPTTGYTVGHRVRVTVEPIERAGELIDAAVAAGASHVDLIRFEVSDQSSLMQEARALAMADAREKARHLAELAGRRLGKAVRIAVAEYRPHRLYDPDYGFYPASYSLPRDPYQTELRPGTVEFGLSVSVTFALED
jgi:uncharacterized protein YggE